MRQVPGLKLWFVLAMCLGLTARPGQADVSLEFFLGERPAGLERAAAYIYKTVDQVALPAFVVTPQGWQAADRRPAIVFYFGGGWRSGSPSQFATQAEYLASRGMVAVCVEYRVHSRHQARVSDCVADAKSALRWVRSHAALLGIDPARIAAAGGSAGGHLAAAVATLQQFDDPQDDAAVSCRPDACALFNPAVDLSPEGLGRDPASAQHTEMASRLGADLHALSPIEHVAAGLPPTIIFHGEADATVPYAQVVAYRDAMVQAGNRCDLVGYPEQPHGFFNANREDRGPYEDTLRRLDEFLASLGWLSGPPTIPRQE
jgi:acetyl esterase/lipase